MRQLGILFSNLITLFVFALPQLPAQETNQMTSGLHCLWKARGASNTVYFLGSIYELRETDHPFPEIMESAFINSRIAVFESDFSKPLDSNTVAKLRAKMWLPAGTTLKDLLSAPVYVSFSNHVEEAGQSMVKSFDSLNPAAALEKLKLAELKRLGANFDYGVDKHFVDIAQKSGKQIMGLETPDLEIDSLINFSNSEQELMVERFLADNEEKQFNELVSAWKNGDLIGLEKIMNKQWTNAPTVFKKQITDRNAAWMPKIRQFLCGSQNVTIIVGAFHLIGPDGIIESLKKQGFKIAQL